MQQLNPELIKSATLLGDFESGTDEWHELRNEPGAIGGSQIGTIAGWNKWESAITRWYKATGQIADELKPSHRMRMGSKFEDDILEIFIEDHPELNVFVTGTWASNAEPLNRANPDGIYVDANGELGLIEVKFMSDNAYEIPLSYRAQMMWYMGILGIKRGYLVACAGSNYVELPIEFDQFEYDTLIQLAAEFRNCVFEMRRPEWEGSDSTLQTIRAVNPDIDSNETEELGDLGMHLSNAYAELQESEKKYRELQSRTLDAMGKAKWGAVYDDVVLYRTQRGNGAPYLAWKKGK